MRRDVVWQLRVRSVKIAQVDDRNTMNGKVWLFNSRCQMQQKVFVISLSDVLYLQCDGGGGFHFSVLYILTDSAILGYPSPPNPTKHE